MDDEIREDTCEQRTVTETAGESGVVQQVDTDGSTPESNCGQVTGQ